MRIVFICGSVERGRDGVGDYTRLLAEELARRGEECLILGLNDHFVDSVGREKQEICDVVRYPSSAPWCARMRWARRDVECFSPDWVSIQFVSYAFHPKGIPLALESYLRQITSGYPVHLMCHELWIGQSRNSSLRDRVIGAVQRYLVRRMVQRLQPVVVHTQTKVYSELLRHVGIQASLLPLFGNIPVVQKQLPARLCEVGQYAGRMEAASNHSGCLMGGFFGTIHPEWHPEALLAVLRRTASSMGKKLALSAMGRLGRGRDIWAALVDRYPDVDFTELGEQPPDVISEWLQSIDFGVATTPWNLIAKSGTTISMLEHGLPVVVARDDFQLRGRMAVRDEGVDELLVSPRCWRQAKRLQLPPKRIAKSRLQECVGEFRNTLRRAASRQ